MTLIVIFKQMMYFRIPGVFCIIMQLIIFTVENGWGEYCIWLALKTF